jgi:sulfur-oxidizing protein SoxZ
MISMPASAKKGDLVEIHCLIMHPMATGLHKDEQGRFVVAEAPAHFVRTVAASFNGKPLMTAQWGIAVSTNPFLGFTMRAEQSGTLKIVWQDNWGGRWSAESKLAVS